MRIAMICRNDNSGLGTVSWEFARHLKPDKIHFVHNGVYQTFPERYKDFKHVPKEELLDDVDVLISFETFYDWKLVADARKKGVKTVLYTMYEMSPPAFPYMPSLLLCPSKLDYDVFKDYSTYVEYLPYPIATDRLIWHKKTEGKIFVHPASHGGVNGRKGTQLLIDAMRFVKSQDIEVRIYGWNLYWSDDPRIKSQLRNFENYWQVYREGDVLIYPQDYNGISLPVVEAMASGMAVVSTDIYPFNEYLPEELLFKPKRMYRGKASPNLMEVDMAEIDPEAIAEKIDYAAQNPITQFSKYGKQYAEENSWDVLLPKYLKVLEEITKT